MMLTSNSQAPQAPEAVKAGVAWLNETIPDWRTHMDVGTLDLRSMKQCALSQASGMSYDNACASYSLRAEDRVALGFTLDMPLNDTFDERNVRWNQLQAAWLEELTK